MLEWQKKWTRANTERIRAELMATLMPDNKFEACGHSMEAANVSLYNGKPRCKICKRYADKVTYARKNGVKLPAPVKLPNGKVMKPARNKGVEYIPDDVSASPNPVIVPPPSPFVKQPAAKHAPKLNPLVPPVQAAPVTFGCGAVHGGFHCTDHEGGRHVVKNADGKVILSWPILATGQTSLLDLDRPASADCSQCGQIAPASPARRVLGACDAHVFQNPSHGVFVEGYVPGSATERRKYTYTKLRDAATAGEKTGQPTPWDAAAFEEPVKKAVPLPRGGMYRVRELAGRDDVTVLRLLATEKLPVLLYGPPGTGKTTLVSAAFPEHERLDGDGDTITDDFVGRWTPTGNPLAPYRWADGPLTAAMRKGVPLFVDDASLVSPKVIGVLYPVMDGRADLVIKAHSTMGEDDELHDEIVQAADGFYVIAGHNPGTHGAVISPALGSRFLVHIEVPSDLELARELGVPVEAIKIASHLEGRMASNDVSWAPQLRELIAFKRIDETIGRDAALANLAGLGPPEDRSDILEAIKTVTTRELKPLRLGAAL